MPLKKGREDMADKIQIIAGTSNPHKIHELNEITKGSNVEFVPIDKDFDPDENGLEFIENARIKAIEAAKISDKGMYFMADDSGLCVDCLNGAPGIRSARYAETPEKRIEKLLSAIKDNTTRTAHFICALCLVNKNGEIIHEVEGRADGTIAKEIIGKNGFGYDPVFIVNGLNRTMAELTEAEKNNISHRGKAVKSMLKWIKDNL